MRALFIGNVRVDISRCIVHRENDSVSLEPKVIQVLLFLVKHQGEVVSHQALLDEIWPNTIVDPSSLQRCIAQLRKAFLDNAKQQRVIATYPKNGYSLLSKIRWEEPKKSFWLSFWHSKIPYALLGGAFTFFAALAVAFLLQANSPAEELPLLVEPDAALTQDSSPRNRSDFYAVYSPDGRYVVYPRFINGRYGHLWAQDLTSGEQLQLTLTPGYYEYTAWSPDSEKIAFVESNCLDELCLSASCSALNMLSLPLGNGIDTLIHPMQNLISCTSVNLQSPEWLNTNEIALIERGDQTATIVKYDIKRLRREVLYQQAGKTPYHLAYSDSAHKLAISISSLNAEQELLLLSMDTGDFNFIPLTISDFTQDEPLFPTWNQQATGLLLTSITGVFNIELDGTVSKLSFPYLP